ncbi:DUF3761 domain-containing protein [Rhodoblastus sp.]
MLIVFAVLAASTIATGASCNLRGHYVAASGHLVKNPRCYGHGNAGAHYRCRDGSYSHSEHRRGACSRHGGVARSL